MPQDNKQKRKLKGEPRLKVQLNEEQKKVTELLYQFDVIIVEGTWGSGKSLSAVATALKSFRKKEFNEIKLTRAYISDNLGALPGGIEDKLHLEMKPLLENINKCQNPTTTEKMIADGNIVIEYNGKIKGNTFSDAICVCDEAQDLTEGQFIEMLTRLGKDSKIIFTLSGEQIHPKIGNKSCFEMVKRLEESELVGWVKLKTNHRNPIIKKITDFLKL